MGVLDFLKKSGNKSDKTQYRYKYQPQQDAIVEQFIEQNFGPIDTVIHDICGDNIKLDLCFISPNDHNPSYLLVTKGLGAYIMAQSPNSDPAFDFSRIELMLDSGEPWEIGFGDNRDIWAQELCAEIANLIVNNGLILNPGRLNLDEIGIAIEECAPSFEVTTTDQFEAYSNFATQVAISNNANVSFLLLVDNEEEEEGEEQQDSNEVDSEHEDNGSLAMNEPNYLCEVDHLIEHAQANNIDPVNAYNRAALFVLWSAKHNFINPNYLADINADVRAFLQANLYKLPIEELFNEKGYEFAYDYYDLDFPCNKANYLDDLLNYLISRHPNPAPLLEDTDFKDLFLSLKFDDNAQKDIFTMLDKVYDSWSQVKEFGIDEHHELYLVTNKLINSESFYFSPTNDDFNLTSSFSYMHESYRYTKDTNKECPVIITLSFDYVKGMINYMCPNSADPDSFAYNEQEKESSITEAMYESESYLGQAPQILGRLMESNIEDFQNNGGSLDELNGDFDSAYQHYQENRELETPTQYDFESYWQDSDMSDFDQVEAFTQPTMLAILPVARPYQVLAYAPFVPTNCGMTLGEMMAVAAYFEDRYDAYVATLSVSTIEFTVDRKLSQAEAEAAAQDLYAFTPYALMMCDVEEPTLADLTVHLMNHQVWTCPFDVESEEDAVHDPEDSSFTF